MKKRGLFGIILIFSILISLFPVTSFASSEGVCGDGLKWTLDDAGTLTISGSGDMYDWVNPTQVPWYPLRQNVKNIIIDSNVKSISKDAFCATAYYNNEDNWENGILYIGNYLIDAKSVTECVIKENVTCIGDYAFFYCINLTNIYIPDSVKSIGENAFYSCVNIRNIKLPDGLNIIGSKAFYGCTGLIDVNIPVGVSYIGDDAFSYCSNIKNISVHRDNQYFCSVDGVLFDKSKSTIIKYPPDKPRDVYYIPYSVKKIGDSAFSGCRGIYKIVVPNSVTHIGNYAFLNCQDTSSIAMSSYITYIGKKAFHNSGYYNVSGNWESGVLYIDKYMIAANNMEVCSIKDGIVCIAADSFKDNEDLSIVNIPGSVAYICNNAFEGCENLLSVNIPEGLIEIGDNAFYDCTSLMGISIPGSLKKIGKSTFGNCGKLSGVFYSKNKAEWDKINIGEDNNYLLNAKMHYNYELVPEGYVFQQESLSIEEIIEDIQNNIDESVSLEIEMDAVNKELEEELEIEI